MNRVGIPLIAIRRNFTQAPIDAIFCFSMSTFTGTGPAPVISRLDESSTTPYFVVVDLDVQRSPQKQQLVKQYYKGYIPDVLVLDARGEPLYNAQEYFSADDGVDVHRQHLAVLG